MSKIVLLLIILLIQAATSSSPPEIQLPNGIIRGREGTTINNKQYYAFEKIPYAAPPVGKLRFKPPIPPDNWDKPLDTLVLDVSCYQRDSNESFYSEDCLYLKVITPQLPTGSNSPGLATLVYIHGGAFVGGSGVGSYGDRFIEKDVIYAAMNYRLGPFGFLSTEDEVISGNNGLKDQQLALKWLHNNIHLFGGDPDKITIFGTSAGSASCAYQLLNQESTDLFRGAILESGSFLSPWSFQRNARKIAFDYGALINTSLQANDDSQVLLQVLQSVDAVTLNTAAQQYRNKTETFANLQLVSGLTWAPVIEVKTPDAFLTKKMYALLKGANVVRVPIILGMDSGEALTFNQDINSLTWNNGQWDIHLDWLVPDDMGITNESARTEMGRKIREIYTGGEPLANHLGAGVKLVSDNGFTRSIIKHAEIYSQFGDAYLYQFSYDGTLGHLDVQYDDAEHVGHTQEVPYLLCGGTSCDMSGYPEADRVTAARLVELWTNFANYLNPTPEPSQILQNLTWPLVFVNNGDLYYMDIEEDLKIKNHPKEDTYGKWTKLYDSLGTDDFDTF